jgi:replication-associated recombination protein RarA
VRNPGLDGYISTDYMNFGSKLKAKLALPPIPKHSMVGRNREMDAILGVIASDVTARVVILGPPGIGKTTLATAVLHHPQIKAKYPVHRY